MSSELVKPHLVLWLFQVSFFNTKKKKKRPNRLHLEEKNQNEENWKSNYTKNGKVPWGVQAKQEQFR